MTRVRRTRRPRSLGGLGAVLGMLAAAAAVTVFAGGYGGGAVADPPTVSTRVSGASAQDDLLAAGRKVFLRDCAWCHAEDGSGTENGPSLEDSGALTADFYLRTGRMPLESPDQRVDRGPPSYPDDVIAALDEYVASLGTGPGLISTAPGDIFKGRRLFLTHCAACHSASGTGMIMTGGNWAPELWETHPDQVAEAIRIGPGPMPPFTDKQLEKEEVDDIVSYVNQLGRDQVVGGAPIEQYGPIMEGILVWLVGMPVIVLVIRLLGKRSKS